LIVGLKNNGGNSWDRCAPLRCILEYTHTNMTDSYRSNGCNPSISHTQLEMEELQWIRQQEEEERLEGSSGMSWKEKVIGCGSSAGPGLPLPAEGTAGCTATGDRMEFLSLRAKGYPLTWRREMSEARSDDCKDKGQRTEDASRHRRQGQRMAGLVAMLVDSISHSRGRIIRREEAIRGRMDE
jgi:hypothetical protein